MNKWDLVEKETDTMQKMRLEIQSSLSYMPYAQIVFISAAKGQRLPKLFEEIVSAYEQACKRVPTGLLNEVLNDAISRVQPPSDKGKRLKIYYATQVSVCPPAFVLFCNNSELFHFSYRRYIENRFREVFGFTGTPLNLIVREKADNEDIKL